MNSDLKKKLSVLGALSGLMLVSASAYAYNIQAAQTAAASNSNCSSLSIPGGFYWEIGNGGGLLTNGSQGSSPPLPATQLYVDSASKWLWGSYVIQKKGGVANLSTGTGTAYKNTDVSYLQMGNGYENIANLTCTSANTIAQCYAQWNNSTQNTGDVGKFYYSGSQFLAHANNNMGLGSLNNAGLTSEMATYLTGFTFQYVTPNPAVGGYISTNDYTKFLRIIINDGLLMHDALGVDSWCTNTGSSGSALLGTKVYYCPTAVSSPPLLNNASWAYSLGHWVETDPSSNTDGGVPGDGSFSSPGASGFYPWIDATKTYYGVIAPNNAENLLVLNETAYEKTVACGQAIRAAFMGN